MSPIERWLPIAGFEGFYSVSSHGRHPRCTISDETVRAIRASKDRSVDIAAAYGINYSYVRAIQTGITRKFS